MHTIYRQECFLRKESDTKILQSIYFAYKVGIISAYSNKILKLALLQFLANFVCFNKSMI